MSSVLIFEIRGDSWRDRNAFAQGSGKSISMCCYAGKLLQQPEMANPTLVVVTDRNNLDGQLYQQFCAAKDLLKQTPEQAESRDQLRNVLAARQKHLMNIV